MSAQQLTQAHHFLIRVDANPNAVLDLLDERINADVNFQTRVHTWRFPDGSEIRAREGEDIDLSLTWGEAR